MDLPDGLLTVLRRAFAGHDDEQQAVFGVDGRMVPIVALVVVMGVVRVAVLLLLADVVPLLVERDFTGPRGFAPLFPIIDASRYIIDVSRYSLDLATNKGAKPVRGGKSHEFVVVELGLVAGEGEVA